MAIGVTDQFVHERVYKANDIVSVRKINQTKKPIHPTHTRLYQDVI